MQVTCDIDIDPEKEYPCSQHIVSKGFTKLMGLVIHGNDPHMIYVILSLIAEDKAAINAKNDIGWTPLMLAAANTASKYMISIIKLLIKNGANVNDRSADGCTALMHIAYDSNHKYSIDAIKILLANGADINLHDNEGFTALIYACDYCETNSNIETVKVLLDNNAKVNASDNTGYTALMYVENQNIDIVNLLIGAGANVNQCDNRGYTALIVYITNEINYTPAVQINSIKALIQAGANVNLRNKFGKTALMLSIWANCIKLCKILIKAGADIYIGDAHNQTAYELASRSMSPAITSTDMIKYYVKQQLKLERIRVIKNINYKYILKNIPVHANNIKYRPGSIGSKIVELSFMLKYGKNPIELYNYLVSEHSFIIEYLGIATVDKFVTIINSYVGGCD